MTSSETWGEGGNIEKVRPWGERRKVRIGEGLEGRRFKADWGRMAEGLGADLGREINLFLSQAQKIPNELLTTQVKWS
jgi:hypothetical protein